MLTCLAHLGGYVVFCFIGSAQSWYLMEAFPRSRDKLCWHACVAALTTRNSAAALRSAFSRSSWHGVLQPFATTRNGFRSPCETRTEPLHYILEAHDRQVITHSSLRSHRSQTTTTTRMTMTTTLRLASTDGSNLPQSPGSGSLLQLVTVLRCRHKPHRDAQPPQAPVQLKFRSASEWLH